MKVIGLTGGIGSGKSTLLSWFRDQGIPCFESDAVARNLLKGELKQKVSNLFGNTLYNIEGNLDRAVLAKKVFGNTKALTSLNKIVHPEVLKAFEDFKKDHHKSPFVINEAAILFETGIYKTCDLVILVKAPKNVRIQRIISRDGVKKEDVLNRMKHQWSDKKKEQFADYIIENISFEETLYQAANLMNMLND